MNHLFWLSAACIVVSCGGEKIESKTAPTVGVTATASASVIPPPSVSVASGSNDPDGGGDPLSPQVIQRIVRSHFRALKHCYQAGLRKDPNLAGRVEIRFVIDPTGQVTSAADQAPSAVAVPDPAVVECIAEAFKALRFPAGGRTVTVGYPLLFQPGS